MLGEYEACIVASSCVVPVLLFAWPPELPEDEPEEPPHEAASITITPTIVPTSVIRFMTFSTFLRGSCLAALYSRGLWTSLLPGSKNVLRKWKTRLHELLLGRRSFLEVGPGWRDQRP
jgi:hypothetical protein